MMRTLFQNKIKEIISGRKEIALLTDRLISKRSPLYVRGPVSLYRAALVEHLSRHIKGDILVISPDESHLNGLAGDLAFFDKDCVNFPWWGKMIYRGVSPQASVFGERMFAMRKALDSPQKNIFLTSALGAYSLLPPVNEIEETACFFQVGKSIDPEGIGLLFQKMGYLRVPRVTAHGEFAIRGEVIDFFPPGSDSAYRIVFDFETIEQIKAFDPVNQISQGDKVDSVTAFPLKEVLWSEERIMRLLSALDQRGIDSTQIQEDLETKREFRGEEIFFPLAFDNPACFVDYLKPESLVIFLESERITSVCQQSMKDFGLLFDQFVTENGTTVRPEDFIRIPDNLESYSDRTLQFLNLAGGEDENEVFYIPCGPSRSFFGNIKFLKGEISNYRKAGYEIFIFSESESQSSRIEYLLKEDEINVVTAPLSAGFFIDDARIGVIQENEIFGRKKRQPASLKKVQSQAIDSFVELSPGDIVVHLNYGIGRFKGIKRMKAAGHERDYIAIEYAGEENIFIPIEQVNLVQRYIGQNGREPKLDKIGSSSWEKKKNKVKKKVEDLADRLITLYSRRIETKGFAFPRDDDFQNDFEASFPYQETEDQLTAIADVKRDMETPKPMERLICGDVGYGKTEIAMRAAFKAVMGGKQVAFLCPTTILAEQHYENFLERFKRFPVKIGMMSRFVPRAEQRTILKNLEEGELDIIIGTHRVLSKDIRFKNLGLMMIDEEQRFGVKHKEKMKEYKASIDCLTLSATPIPRTLHMSLVQIRDMSTLQTPPSNRKAIETIIQEYDPDTVAAAIRRETARGGQVFYLHNRVESLESICLYLQQIVPEVYVEYAHGQMTPTQLEDIMHRFIHGSFQVLVSTTIIENGIDIPNVNTIIIDRADLYGISQLYQLKGRVGRSERLAYAYLLYPQERALSELAMKRLQIISDFTELGAGFKIALKDMEVRGAGNLLGAEQSGEILAVGFDLYVKMLSDAMEERRQIQYGEQEEKAPEVYLELEYTGFIPESYISDPVDKMEIYKRISSVNSEEELEQIYTNIYDRFGPLPDDALSLLALAEIRIICSKLWISSLRERNGMARITFGKVSRISIDKLMNLIRVSGNKVKLDPASPETLLLETGAVGLKEKADYIKDILSGLI